MIPDILSQQCLKPRLLSVNKLDLLQTIDFCLDPRLFTDSLSWMDFETMCERVFVRESVLECPTH